MNKQIKFHLDITENNIKILEEVFNSIKNYLPLNYENYQKIKHKDFKILDVIAYRFIKIQSILGEKLFREILNYAEYDIQNKSYIEILSELERMGILKVNDWRFLRELRNTFSHDYPDNEKEIIEAINSLYFELNTIKEIYENLKAKYEQIFKIKQMGN